MNRTFILLAATLTAPSLADDAIDHRIVTGTPVYIERVTTVEIKVAKVAKDPEGAKAAGRDVLVRFSVTPFGPSSLRSFIVAGKVIGNNVGAREEMVPLFFGSPMHPPRLAALTNADGEFRFTIWLKEDHGQRRLQTPTLDEGVLYLGSRFAVFDDGSAAFKSMPAYAYSFRELFAASTNKPEPKPADAK